MRRDGQHAAGFPKVVRVPLPKRFVLRACRWARTNIGPVSNLGLAMPAKRILLVEDDFAVRSLFTLVLRRVGYSIDEAGTVAEAMVLLDAGPYDLALVDWRVPDGDGLLVADSAAQLGAETIMMSGYLPEMPGGRAYGHESVMKPIMPSELVDAVRRVIGKPSEAG